MVPQPRDAAPTPLGSPRDLGSVVDRVRDILRSQGFTLYRAAALTRARYPGQPAYHLRRNFYFQLRSGLSPTFPQVVALAAVTGLGLWDWLNAFNLSLANIPRLQSTFSRPRTGVIESQLVDPELLLPSLRFRQPRSTWPGIAPFSQLVEESGPIPAAALMARSRRDFLYARIGSADVLAFPEIAPGSIVRADPLLVPALVPVVQGELSHSFFLLETNQGFRCARLQATGPHRVALIGADRALPATGLLIDREIRILGVVDFAFHFRPAGRKGPKPVHAAQFREPPQSLSVRTNAGQRKFLRHARQRAGLSFRVASELSQEIANSLGDSRYFASPGTLSDYEASDKLPRHIHKLFTVAILYAVRVTDLLRSYGVGIETDDFLDSLTPRTREDQALNFLDAMADEFGGVPTFLSSALPALVGLARVSLRDIFWVGGQTQPLHPALRRALFVLVNRRSKNPRYFRRAPLGEQPPYLLQERNGRYLLASCSIENGRLTLHTDTGNPPSPIDAEILGQVVAIARCMLPAI